MSAFEDTILDRLSGVLDEVDRIRIHALAQKKRATNICIIVAIVGVLIGLLVSAASGNMIPLVIVGVLVIIVCLFTYYFICGDSLKKFKHAYKTSLVAGIAKTLQPEMEFHPYKGISKETFKSCGH